MQGFTQSLYNVRTFVSWQSHKGWSKRSKEALDVLPLYLLLVSHVTFLIWALTFGLSPNKGGSSGFRSDLTGVA